MSNSYMQNNKLKNRITLLNSNNIFNRVSFAKEFKDYFNNPEFIEKIYISKLNKRSNTRDIQIIWSFK